MINIQFQKYIGGITESKPNGEIDLSTFVYSTKYGWDNIPLYNQVRAARSKAERNQLKAKLNHFTPAVIVQDRRTKESIKEFTGLMQIDLDSMENKTTAELIRDVIFENCSCIVSSFLSPSGTGVKCLLKIPIVRTTAEYKALHQGFGRYFCIPNGLQEHYDSAAANAVLPMYASYDSGIRYRANFDTWTLKYEPEKEIQPTELKPVRQTQYNGTLLVKIQNRIAAICEPHHPDLRNYCFWLGGMFASTDYQRMINAPSESDIKTVIIDSIMAHPYMGTVEPEGRVKTALDSFDAGKLHPKNMPPK
jgi:hypothetical protein